MFIKEIVDEIPQIGSSLVKEIMWKKSGNILSGHESGDQVKKQLTAVR